MLGRRLLVLKLAALGGAVGTASTAAASTGNNATTVQYRTGLTDSDPHDAPGYGRGGYRPRGTGLTDSDPHDAPGNGRGGYRPRGTGLTDSDPHDSPGYGRRGY